MRALQGNRSLGGDEMKAIGAILKLVGGFHGEARFTRLITRTGNSRDKEKRRYWLPRKKLIRIKLGTKKLRVALCRRGISQHWLVCL